MKIFVDIDNTICSTKGNDYKRSSPLTYQIDKINKLYDEGHDITYWTARGGTSGKDWAEFTLHQLRSWGCKFHQLSLTKPSYDLLFDDKAEKL